MANGFVRATSDSDLLVPDGAEADTAIHRFFERIDAVRLSDDKVLTPEEIAEAQHLRVKSRHGIVDLVRGGAPPLDFDSVAANAMEVDVGGHPARIASLRSIVGFKRLAGRPQDKRDLEELKALHGELPVDPIPGLDT